MTMIKHELKQGWKSLAIWTICIGFFIVICVAMYPEMKGEMEGVNDIFASMGAFTDAFGMDRLNFGTLIGFYAIECGNILGIGGAFFASLIDCFALWAVFSFIILSLLSFTYPCFAPPLFID